MLEWATARLMESSSFSSRGVKRTCRMINHIFVRCRLKLKYVDHHVNVNTINYRVMTVHYWHLAKITNTLEPHHLIVLPTVRKDHLGPILAQPNIGEQCVILKIYMGKQFEDYLFVTERPMNPLAPKTVTTSPENDDLVRVWVLWKSIALIITNGLLMQTT